MKVYRWTRGGVSVLIGEAAAEDIRKFGCGHELEEVSDPSRTFFWLSFADDAGFLGAAIVEAPTFLSAVIEARAQGVNPGGEVKGLELEGVRSEKDLGPYVVNKLYSKADIDAIDKAVKWDDKALIKPIDDN